ncbi:TVP38/TMEM64 family protein [Pseudoneobacillus sp. C159]
MSDLFFEWIPENKNLIVIISILVNVGIAISGILPSAFLTAANISIFGFKMGLLLSIMGEAVGAIVSFILYRKGLTKLSSKIYIDNRWLLRLHSTKGLEAVVIVLFLRILPFVPSGVVTLVASYSQMSVYAFSIASTIGKVPSLFIEAFAVNQALHLSMEWQLIIMLFILVIFIFILGKRGT